VKRPGNGPASAVPGLAAASVEYPEDLVVLSGVVDKQG
jgi:hypothetical protein